MLRYQLVLLAGAISLIALAVSWGMGSALAVVGLAVVAAVAERGRVRMDRTFEVSISLLPTVFAAAVFGPLAGALVSASSYVGDFPYQAIRSRHRSGWSGGEQLLRWGIYTCI